MNGNEISTSELTGDPGEVDGNWKRIPIQIQLGAKYAESLRNAGNNLSENAGRRESAVLDKLAAEEKDTIGQGSG